MYYMSRYGFLSQCIICLVTASCHNALFVYLRLPVTMHYVSRDGFLSQCIILRRLPVTMYYMTRDGFLSQYILCLLTASCHNVLYVY